MKNYMLFCLCLLLSFSCNDVDDVSVDQEVQIVNEVIGTWELFRSETLETVLDEWTGTEWTTTTQWFAQIWEDSRILISFNEDGSFTEFYADVPVFHGVWEKTGTGSYTLDYTQEDGVENEALEGRRIIQIHCENSYSIAKENDESRIDYFKTPSTTACNDLIAFKTAE